MGVNTKIISNPGIELVVMGFAGLEDAISDIQIRFTAQINFTRMESVAFSGFVIDRRLIMNNCCAALW